MIILKVIQIIAVIWFGIRFIFGKKNETSTIYYGIAYIVSILILEMINRAC